MNSSVVKEISHSTGKFAISLYNEMTKKCHDKNVCFSPLSLAAVIALTHIGAKKKSSEEIKHVLNCLPVSDDDFHSSFSKLLSSLQEKNDNNNSIDINNCLFAGENHKFLSSFITDVKKYFDADVKNMDFANKPEDCRSEINDIVKKKTNNLIEDFLKSGSISPMTVAILINTIYFKGTWSEQFDKSHTSKEDFFISESDKIEVDMMHISKKFKMNYSEEMKCQVLELPYAGKKLSMFIVLPLEGFSLKEMESSLSHDSLIQLIDNLEMEMKIDVSLPKFKIQYDSEMKTIFQNLGLNEAFQPGIADFSGMDGTKQIYLSEILHKACIEVNEEGTVAAAASASMMMMMCLPPQFVVDKPFMFLIRDNDSKLILFMGHVINPNL